MDSQMYVAWSAIRSKYLMTSTLEMVHLPVAGAS
jgi:hypothetical protein